MLNLEYSTLTQSSVMSQSDRQTQYADIKLVQIINTTLSQFEQQQLLRINPVICDSQMSYLATRSLWRP